MEGRKFSSSRAGRHLRARLPRALRRRRAALLRRGRWPGDPRCRLHLGGVRPAQQRRARRRVGQPGEPDRSRWPRRTSARSRRPATLTEADRDAARDRRRPAFGTSATLLEQLAAEGRRFRRRCASWLRPTSTSPTGAVEAEDDDPARKAPCCTSACRRSATCNTILTPFLPHSAQQVHETLGGTGEWSGLPEIREVSEEGNADYPVIRWATTPLRPRDGRASRSSRAQSWTRRRSSSGSSIPRLSRRSWLAWRPRPTRDRGTHAASRRAGRRTARAATGTGTSPGAGG